MTANEQNTRPLIEQCQGLVRSLAASIHRKLPPKFELDDLIAYGQVGLAEAARDFSPQYGSQFSTFAYYRIRGAIYDGLSKMAWFSRTEYNKARYQQRANELLGADAEESAVYGSSQDDARWFRDLCRTLSMAYITCHGAYCGENEAKALVDASTPSQQAIDSETIRIIRKQIDALPANEAKFIRALYFEGMTMQQAGEQLGISKSWASRLHRNLLQRLSRSLKQIGMGA